MFLLKILLFAFVAYYILKSVAKFFLPFLFRDIEERIKGKGQAYYKNKKEGEITIQFGKDNTSNKSKNIGEYVDFEELKNE